jgi:prepilin-type N-terminal cleavage/methylation domain-containing protein
MSASSISGQFHSRTERRLSHSRSQAGLTLVEVLVTMAVLGILAGAAVPWVSCSLDKARYARTMADLGQVRDSIEAYEAELGAWPPDLEAAMRGRPVPKSLVYCTESGDANKGHGNETCFFFDPDNPSGKNKHGGIPGAGYLLRTHDMLSECADVRVAWTTCCGQPPIIIAWNDDTKLPGHPGGGNGGGNQGGGNQGGGNQGGGNQGGGNQGGSGQGNNSGNNGNNGNGNGDGDGNE